MKSSVVVVLLFFFISSCSSRTFKDRARTTVISEKTQMPVLLTTKFEENSADRSLFSTGEVVISREQKLSDIWFISDRRAIVRKQGSNGFFLFHVDSKKFDQISDSLIVTDLNPAYPQVLLSYNNSSYKVDSYDVTVYFPLAKEPVRFQGLIPPKTKLHSVKQVVVHGGQFIVIHSFSKDQDQGFHSRVYNLAGELIGESDLGVYQYKTLHDLKSMKSRSEFAIAESVIKGENFKGFLNISVLDNNGMRLQPIAGSTGTIGLLTDRGTNLGYVHLYPINNSSVEYEAALAIGPYRSTETSKVKMRDFLAFSHDNMPHPNYSLFFQGLDGSWNMHPLSSHEYKPYFNPSERYLNRHDLAFSLRGKLNEHHNTLNQKAFDERDKFLATPEGKKQAAVEEARRQLEYKDNIRHKELMLTDPKYYCSRFDDATQHSTAAVIAFLKNCSVTDAQLEQARWRKVDPSIIEFARKSRDGREAHKARIELNERERFINAQRPTYDPQINVGSGVGGSAEKGTYGTQQQRKVWEKNINKTIKRK